MQRNTSASIRARAWDLVPPPPPLPPGVCNSKWWLGERGSCLALCSSLTYAHPALPIAPELERVFPGTFLPR